MSDASSGFTGPDSPVFLNVTAPTEILLCEETLEMILTVATIHPRSHSLPLVAATFSLSLPEAHFTLCFRRFS